MTLNLYYHPFSSYCQKALLALYENDTSFTPHLIDLSNAASRAKLTDIWPIGKFPVLRDEARNQTIPESSIIIEYLAQHYPGKSQLVPSDSDLARQARMRDRFYDQYINDPVGVVVRDTFRPAGKSDAIGVDQAKAMLHTAYGVVEKGVEKAWAIGESFTMADCAAAPALFYGNLIVPLADGYKNAGAYLDRLLARPSFRRALKDALPYAKNFPFAEKYLTTYKTVIAGL